MKKLLEDMRISVRACNKYLHNVVEIMGYDELDCNCHPIDRSNFTRRLNLITGYKKY